MLLSGSKPVMEPTITIEPASGTCGRQSSEAQMQGYDKAARKARSLTTNPQILAADVDLDNRETLT